MIRLYRGKSYIHSTPNLTVRNRTALNAWMQAMKKHRDSSALLQSVIDVKREDHLRTIFTAWRIFTRRARERRVLFERLKRERRSKLLSDTFSIWVERKRMRELHAVEEEVSLRHEDVILFTVFDHWKARSKVGPAHHCVSFASWLTGNLLVLSVYRP